ncbi:MAG: hypothetical protein FWH27_11180 [Planctomycetaceae bacterium]|nr:hypothetical protein [Planctomycetaceae bacterium]
MTLNEKSSAKFAKLSPPKRLEGVIFCLSLEKQTDKDLRDVKNAKGTSR